MIIVWIAPWFGIFIIDWIMRRYRYNAASSSARTPDGLYFDGRSGVNWNAHRRLRRRSVRVDGLLLEGAAAGQLPASTG